MQGITHDAVLYLPRRVMEHDFCQPPKWVSGHGQRGRAVDTVEEQLRRHHARLVSTKVVVTFGLMTRDPYH